MATTVIRPGVVTFSVDLARCEGQVLSRSGGRPAPASELAELFTAWNMPLTWVIDDVNRLAGDQRVGEIDGRQEIAVAGDPEWAASGASRRRFAEGLSRRLLRARVIGRSITTLFLRGARDVAHADLALKYGLTVICPIGSSGGSWRPVEPARPRLFRLRGSAAKSQKLRAVRFGLWEITPLPHWPSDGGAFLPIGGLARLRRAIDHAEDQLTVTHLMIDGAAIVKARRRGRRALEKVLRYADARRREGRLQIDTLAGLASRLSTARQSIPSRSILRPAA